MINNRRKPVQGVVGLAALAFLLNCRADNNQEIELVQNALASCASVPQWSVTSHAAGARVQNLAGLYECKPFPFTGWCSQAAYEPGVSPHWRDAWTKIDDCATSAGTPPPSPANEITAVCPDLPGRCCPSNYVPIVLSEGVDVFQTGVPRQCILGFGGADTIAAQGGNHVVLGGAGNDIIQAANGDNFVVPGPGADTVATGVGNDTIFIFDLCEVQFGETYDLGTGFDTLVTPVPLAELRRRGVNVAHVDNVIVQQNSCRSECVTRPVCVHGSCAEGAAAGQVRCACDPGWTGESCAVAVPIPPLSIRPPAELPKPPTAIGCYWHTVNGWEGIPCAPPGYVEANFGRPDIPVQLSSNSFVAGGMTLQAPLVFAQYQSLLPAVAGVTDAFVTGVPAVCPAPGTPTANRWSIQGNTNIFTGNNASRDVVQFVVQSNGSQNSVCVWNIDATAQAYTPTCVVPTPAQRSGGLQPFDSGNLAGFVSATAGTLSIVSQLSWVTAGQPNTYAVVAPDTFGLSGNWFNFDGNILGLGNCSQAQFTDANVVSRLMISSCQGVTQASSDLSSCPTTVLESHVSIVNSSPSVETNNLVQVVAPTVTYLNQHLAAANWTSTTSGACLDPRHIFVRDHNADGGGVPSNQAGQAFWESPDLFLVPQGAPVDLNASPSQTLITPGGTFDVYVRVHNDLGCAPMTGAKALIYLADPSALSTQWVTITGGQYLGDATAPGGDSVPAGGQALIGPFSFTAPPTNFGDGHKCMIAAIIADGEPAVANSFDAPNSNQVAQRNVILDNCAYPLTNATASDGNVGIALTVTPLAVQPSLSVLPSVQVVFDDNDASWYGVWVMQAGSGTDFVVSNAAGKTTVRLGKNGITLAAVPLRAGQSRTAAATLSLPNGSPVATLAIQATLTDAGGVALVTNGGSCQQGAPPIIR